MSNWTLDMRARDLRITKANCPVVDVDVVDFAEQTVQNRAISNLELFIEQTQFIQYCPHFSKSNPNRTLEPWIIATGYHVYRNRILIYRPSHISLT